MEPNGLRGSGIKSPITTTFLHTVGASRSEKKRMISAHGTFIENFDSGALACDICRPNRSNSLVRRTRAHRLSPRADGKKEPDFRRCACAGCNDLRILPGTKDCHYRGTPYVMVPNERLHESVMTRTDTRSHARQAAIRTLEERAAEPILS